MNYVDGLKRLNFQEPLMDYAVFQPFCFTLLSIFISVTCPLCALRLNLKHL